MDGFIAFMVVCWCLYSVQKASKTKVGRAATEAGGNALVKWMFKR